MTAAPTSSAGRPMRGRFGLPASVLVSAALGASLNPLNSTMVAVALPALSDEFAAAASAVTLTVVTGYLVATLVSQVPAGNVADRIGYTRALTLGRWLFLAGAVAGAAAPALWAVVVGRLLMAVGGSMIMPTAMALVRIAVPAERRARAFGTMGAVLGGAAAVGPAVGAWMTSHFGWRSLFVINLPLLAASWMLQPKIDSAPAPEVRQPFDWPGSILIGLSLLLLTFATRSPSPYAWGLAVAGVVAGGVLIRHERRAAEPVLRLPLFTQRPFVCGGLVIAFQNLAMYSLLLIVPFVFGSGTASDSQIGLAIIAMTATMAVTSPVGGWLTERVGARTMVSVGGLTGMIGAIGLALLPAMASPVAIGARLLLVGLGLGLSTGPAQAAALAAAPAHQSGGASATISMLRYLGAVVGTVIIGYALTGDAGAAARHQVALWLFAASFLVSALLGAALPAGAGRAHAFTTSRPAGTSSRDIAGNPPGRPLAR